MSIMNRNSTISDVGQLWGVKSRYPCSRLAPVGVFRCGDGFKRR